MNTETFTKNLKQCREQCEKAGVEWPAFYWPDQCNLLNKFVMYEGNLYKIMATTETGYYGDAIHYEPKNKSSDKNGFIHTMGAPIPNKYDPFKDDYKEEEEKPSITHAIQLTLF